MSYENLTRVSAEHNEWLKGLDFYRDDISILEKRLLEVASANTGSEVGRGVEHFQNQFIIQRNTIDELRHGIREHMSAFGRTVASDEPGGESKHAAGHGQLQDGYASFEKVMNELRQEFNAFLSRWL